MKKFFIVAISLTLQHLLYAGTVEQTFRFSQYSVSPRNTYQEIQFPGTHQVALPGKPSLPWKTVSLVIPPGEIVQDVEIVLNNPVEIPRKIILWPAQPVLPVGQNDTGKFMVDRATYRLGEYYPGKQKSHYQTQFLHGYGFVFTSFTPLEWNPAKKKARYFGSVTVRVHTVEADKNQQLAPAVPLSETWRRVVSELAGNPGELEFYPPGKTTLDPYQYLVVAPSAFKNEFNSLVSLCALKGLNARVITVDSIQSVSTGFDKPEKIRNFIINQYYQHQIQYVLLAGNPALVPCRFLHCSVISGGIYYDSIPSDLYYSALNGNFDYNGNHKYGEIADSADLLPELSVGRFPVNDTAELRKMIRKTVSYQVNPVPGEFSKPLLLGEYLYANPITFGSDYMNLLINDHNDNGYFTHGIPSAENQVITMYDSLISPPLNIWQWNSSQLLAKLNQGNSFIHHLGHANVNSMLRLSTGSITNANFSLVDGINHNFQLLYTQGCDDGAFDKNCIAAKAVKIDNFLVAGIFNSRYGWFNQGTSDGPSEHLEREFNGALFHDTVPENHIGTAHTISKIKTAPWVGLPGEFEPGAQRWCHFGCTLFGDPALTVWTEEPDQIYTITWTGAVSSDWQNPANWSPEIVPGSLCNVMIPQTSHPPAITTAGPFFCKNLTVGADANLTINFGRTLTVYGNVIMSTE